MPWDPTKGERLAPAWEKAMSMMDDGLWHDWPNVIFYMVKHSDLQPQTCANLLYKGIKEGFFQRKGRYNHGTRRDERLIKRRDRW